jgi:hypothetical protein
MLNGSMGSAAPVEPINIYFVGLAKVLHVDTSIN